MTYLQLAALIAIVWTLICAPMIAMWVRIDRKRRRLREEYPKTIECGDGLKWVISSPGRFGWMLKFDAVEGGDE